MATSADKLKELCEVEGFADPIELCRQADWGTALIANGICMNDDCDYTCAIEPDSKTGYCDECHTNTVQSIQMLKFSLKKWIKINIQLDLDQLMELNETKSRVDKSTCMFLNRKLYHLYVLNVHSVLI